MTARLAVLASGRGSNLAAILEAGARGGLDARVVVVFSDMVDASLAYTPISAWRYGSS